MAVVAGHAPGFTSFEHGAYTGPTRRVRSRRPITLYFPLANVM